MKRKTLKITLLTIILCSFYACHCCKKTESSNAKKTESKIAIDYEKENYEKASIYDASEIAGCSFGIMLENEKRLQAINLTSEFQKDKMEVWVKYTVEAVPTACQMGKVARITAIQKR